MASATSGLAESDGDPDFTAQIAERLNIDDDASLRVIGDWLVHYEPKRLRTTARRGQAWKPDARPAVSPTELDRCA